MMKINPLHATDFYKTGHIRQYPEGTGLVYSNFTCRSDKNAKMLPSFDHKVVFFGLQGILHWLLIDTWNQEFFKKPKEEVLARYQRRMDQSLGQGAVNLDHIAELHDLGYLPLHIKALPEGSRVPTRVPVLTVVNTDPRFYWLTNYVETQLSAELWKMITTATTAFEYRQMFEKYARDTGAPKEFVFWQGHDFSMRGMSGIHDATQSGAAHLLSFYGTDTISSIDYLENYYSGGDTFVGGSVPATEHSVMCMGGADEEIETFRRLICDLYPSGIVSIVSDTWDFWKVITEFSKELRSEILARTPDGLGNAKVVFRPDSGDPVKIICGDPNAPVGSPQHKGAVECLWEIFGGTLTEKGFRVLDSHVGLIYGDSITLERADQILSGLKAKGFASCNIVCGIGSYTYQYVTRDTFGTAIKATYGVVHGEARVLYKCPKTDDGVKNSARGLLRVEYDGNHYVLHEMQTEEQEKGGMLQSVFKDGKILRYESLVEIRDRLQKELK
jgi:nicotinamide phosphoribosyltransferase